MSLQVIMAGMLLGKMGASENVTVATKFYGMRDTCPQTGGIQLAFPTVHTEPGGIGTWEDPVTFAAAKGSLDKGSRIYIRGLKKYFVMEDHCDSCELAWKKKRYEINIWIGDTTLYPGPGIKECANALRKRTTVTFHPEKGLPVDTTPLYDPTTQQCAVPTAPCVDPHPDTCATSCEVAMHTSCNFWTNALHMNSSRFQLLNPEIDCTENIAGGTEICTGGLCGI